MSLGGRPCALSTKREIVPAVPMDWMRRLEHYQARNGSEDDGALTPRQRRRWLQKKRAHDGRARRALAAEIQS